MSSSPTGSRATSPSRPPKARQACTPASFGPPFAVRYSPSWATGWPSLPWWRSRTGSIPRRYNGGMFLGLNGVAVKSHGGIDAVGYANAIGFAFDMMTQGFNEKVIRDLQMLGQLSDNPAKAAAQ